MSDFGYYRGGRSNPRRHYNVSRRPMRYSTRRNNNNHWQRNHQWFPNSRHGYQAPNSLNQHQFQQQHLQEPMQRPPSFQRYAPPPLSLPPPSSPPPGSEEARQRQTDKISALIKRQLERPDDTEFSLMTNEFSLNSPNVDVNKRNEYLPPNCQVTSERPQSNTKKVSSPKRTPIHKSGYDKEMILDKITAHISNMSVNQMRNLVNSTATKYDVVFDHIYRQQRQLWSKTLRNVYNDEDCASVEQNDIRNTIIHDIGIKLEDLPREIIAELSNTLEMDMEEIVDFNTQFNFNNDVNSSADAISTTQQQNLEENSFSDHFYDREKNANDDWIGLDYPIYNPNAIHSHIQTTALSPSNDANYSQQMRSSILSTPPSDAQTTAIFPPPANTTCSFINLQDVPATADTQINENTTLHPPPLPPLSLQYDNLNINSINEMNIPLQHEPPLPYFVSFEQSNNGKNIKPISPQKRELESFPLISTNIVSNAFNRETMPAEFSTNFDKSASAPKYDNLYKEKEVNVTNETFSSTNMTHSKDCTNTKSSMRSPIQLNVESNRKDTVPALDCNIAETASSNFDKRTNHVWNQSEERRSPFDEDYRYKKRCKTKVYLEENTKLENDKSKQRLCAKSNVDDTPISSKHKHGHKHDRGLSTSVIGESHSPENVKNIKPLEERLKVMQSIMDSSKAANRKHMNSHVSNSVNKKQDLKKMREIHISTNSRNVEAASSNNAVKNKDKNSLLSPTAADKSIGATLASHENVPQTVKTLPSVKKPWRSLGEKKYIPEKHKPLYHYETDLDFEATDVEADNDSTCSTQNASDRVKRSIPKNSFDCASSDISTEQSLKAAEPPSFSASTPLENQENVEKSSKFFNEITILSCVSFTKNEPEKLNLLPPDISSVEICNDNNAIRNVTKTILNSNRNDRDCELTKEMTVLEENDEKSNITAADTNEFLENIAEPFDVDLNINEPQSNNLLLECSGNETVEDVPIDPSVVTNDLNLNQASLNLETDSSCIIGNIANTFNEIVQESLISLDLDPIEVNVPDISLKLHEELDLQKLSDPSFGTLAPKKANASLESDANRKKSDNVHRKSKEHHSKSEHKTDLPKSKSPSNKRQESQRKHESQSECKTQSNEHHSTKVKKDSKEHKTKRFCSVGINTTPSEAASQPSLSPLSKKKRKKLKARRKDVISKLADVDKQIRRLLKEREALYNELLSDSDNEDIEARSKTPDNVQIDVCRKRKAGDGQVDVAVTAKKCKRSNNSRERRSPSAFSRQETIATNKKDSKKKGATVNASSKEKSTNKSEIATSANSHNSKSQISDDSKEITEKRRSRTPKHLTPLDAPSITAGQSLMVKIPKPKLLASQVDLTSGNVPANLNDERTKKKKKSSKRCSEENDDAALPNKSRSVPKDLQGSQSVEEEGQNLSERKKSQTRKVVALEKEEENVGSKNNHVNSKVENNENTLLTESHECAPKKRNKQKKSEVRKKQSALDTTYIAPKLKATEVVDTSNPDSLPKKRGRGRPRRSENCQAVPMPTNENISEENCLQDSAPIPAVGDNLPKPQVANKTNTLPNDSENQNFLSTSVKKDREKRKKPLAAEIVPVLSAENYAAVTTRNNSEMEKSHDYTGTDIEKPMNNPDNSQAQSVTPNLCEIAQHPTALSEENVKIKALSVEIDKDVPALVKKKRERKKKPKVGEIVPILSAEDDTAVTAQNNCELEKSHDFNVTIASNLCEIAQHPATLSEQNVKRVETCELKEVDDGSRAPNVEIDNDISRLQSPNYKFGETIALSSHELEESKNYQHERNASEMDAPARELESIEVVSNNPERSSSQDCQEMQLRNTSRRSKKSGSQDLLNETATEQFVGKSKNITDNAENEEEYPQVRSPITRSRSRMSETEKYLSPLSPPERNIAISWQKQEISNNNSNFSKSCAKESCTNAEHLKGVRFIDKSESIEITPPTYTSCNTDHVLKSLQPEPLKEHLTIDKDVENDTQVSGSDKSSKCLLRVQQLPVRRQKRKNGTVCENFEPCEPPKKIANQNKISQCESENIGGFAEVDQSTVSRHKKRVRKRSRRRKYSDTSKSIGEHDQLNETCPVYVKADIDAENVSDNIELKEDCANDSMLNIKEPALDCLTREDFDSSLNNNTELKSSRGTRSRNSEPFCLKPTSSTITPESSKSVETLEAERKMLSKQKRRIVQPLQKSAVDETLDYVVKTWSYNDSFASDMDSIISSFQSDDDLDLKLSIRPCSVSVEKYTESDLLQLRLDFLKKSPTLVPPQPTEVCISPNIEEVQDSQRLPLFYEGHKKSILCIKFLMDNIIVGSTDGHTYLYELKSCKLLYTFYGSEGVPPHEKALTSICLNCNEDNFAWTLYTGGLEGKLRVYEMATRQILSTFFVDAPIQCMEIAWNYIFIGSSRGDLFRYDIKKKTFSDKPGKVCDRNILMLIPTTEGGRRVILLATRHSPVSVRDAMSGLLLRSFAFDEYPTVYSIVIHENIVFCGTSQHGILSYSFQDGEPKEKLNVDVKGVNCMSMIKHILFAGCYNGNIYVFNTRTNALIATLEGPGGMLLSMAIRGDMIVVGTKQDLLKAWQIPKFIMDEVA